MNKTIAYIRVSTAKQDMDTQEFEILRYSQRNKIQIDTWIKLKISSRKSLYDRGIENILETLSKGDTLITSEISRIGRSLSQVVYIIDKLINKGVNFIAIKQNMHLTSENNMTSKIQIGLFALMSELERDLLSERTKVGVQRARESGKVLGKPRNCRHSKLDSEIEKIQSLLEKNVSKSSIAKMLDVTPQAMHYFIKTRKLC
ncbi:recombinase family protein [Halodesulfovibrio marinisediminis]|uniref:Site-specific DNA recombinase n=1 Tax=Halodesulfovibrio marinisediminis DSM 17456 TaxID=1121457 RepID=A0A1N6FNJ0_9BACT|nr:recombinase family protein [Halodesulfovibrio marinisediminis]SIN96836.1 Site-specific DNA recombinase [Halodesulfovibrio marinisediminis DSM 17456]